MKVSIGITTYRPENHPQAHKFTQRLLTCLPSVASLREYGHELSVVVVDDGSKRFGEHHNTVKRLCDEYDFEYEIYWENRGVSRAKNTCLRWFKQAFDPFDIGFLLDDDAEVIGDLAGFYDQRMRETGVKHAGYWSSRYHWIPNESVTINQVPVMKLEHTNGLCLVFRPEMLTAVGAFRVLPHKFYYEHVDWSDRAVKAGLCPYQLDFVGSDRYLKIQPANGTSTIGYLPHAQRLKMTQENEAAAKSFSDVFLAL
jgi:glycosyltransferase involved in cell wall biosynthesis